MQTKHPNSGGHSHIAVTGGTGFIGRHLVELLKERGYAVTVISRSRRSSTEGTGSNGISSERFVTWKQLEENPSLLEGIYGIVNLAGESINQRWTYAAKQRILESRLDAAARIAALVDRLDRKPQVVVNGSGMNIYGTSDTEIFDESSPADPSDFLSGVVAQWEKAADNIDVPRLVKIRIGLVLGGSGGAFPKMALPYKLGVGGRVGSGRQWLSWIHIRDMVRLIEYGLTHSDMQGAYNATAPEPVTNDTFGRMLGRVLGRPHWLPVPSLAMQLLFGELSELLLKGQKVLPRRLTEAGFRFEYPTLEQALQHICAQASTYK